MNSISEIIAVEQLVSIVQEFHQGTWRLVQMCATTLPDTLELNYSFDKELTFRNLQLILPRTGATMPSISGIYANAFLYENEIHDLFGITFEGLTINFKGNFYVTEQKTPFNQKGKP